MVVHEDRERGSWCLGHEHGAGTAASSPKKGMVYESRRISTSCVKGRRTASKDRFVWAWLWISWLEKALSTVH